jgi:hypothetical protein
LHGLTLEAIVTALVAHYGWVDLGARVPVRCFTHDPSIPSSLKFLRRTPWAREKVEQLYLFMLGVQRGTPSQSPTPTPTKPGKGSRPRPAPSPDADPARGGRAAEPARADTQRPAAPGDPAPRPSGLSGLRPVRRS